MMARIIGKEEPKHDLQVRQGGALLCLGGEVRLGRELLRLGGPEKYINPVSGPPRQRSLRLGRALSLGEALCLGVHSYTLT